MAKGPSKRTKSKRTTPLKGKLTPPVVGGKNLTHYMKNKTYPKQPKSRRRFSLVSSSSSDSDNLSVSGSEKIDSGSDSDSSLTAVSDNGMSDRSSVVFEDKPRRQGKTVRKGFKGKSIKAFGSKKWAAVNSDDMEDSDEFESAEEEDEYSSSDDEDVDFVKLQAQKKIKTLVPEARNKAYSPVPKPKFGRRRSEAALPEDINFKFEFNDDDNDNAIDSDSEEEEVKITSTPKVDMDEIEEDIGEEIELPHLQDSPQNLHIDLEFNTQLILAPKFNEDDLNSDDDYEIDDNALLATLQADNDLEEFNHNSIRQSSIVSVGEDDEEEEFLKEEEKFLVNEFENNGFDEEETTNDPTTAVSEDGFTFEEDEEEDFIDFTISEEISTPKKKTTNDKLDSDDDSYLWNYFFSSDNESDSEPTKKPQPENETYAIEEDDTGYDSTESTDVDENIPLSSTNTLGSQKAKEVLSSKTADYRPPILGSWVALESKPFGIIDGLSTRILSGTPGVVKHTERDRKPRKSIGTPHMEDPGLGLDDILNMSEMDYDDTDDAKIWRDFNNNKKRVPLGAFRNKAFLQNSLQNPVPRVQFNHTSKSNNDFNQRRYSLSSHKKGKAVQIPSKLKRRRASKVEAFKEGFRPTKSGLFSEQALLDVEQTLGDDNDIMALIKGL